ncbi:uncharacterized protein LOC107633782 [Arachis ipaensis]|uniref:uncharacterized protein LOC107633782 n=1 Tax=Arachis ipaensis TaxID=130454 RepID=UPI000A2AFDA1|nr:uncharacterized protein LOC107633782 [Arachis ipaensis]
MAMHANTSDSNIYLPSPYYRKTMTHSDLSTTRLEPIAVLVSLEKPQFSPSLTQLGLGTPFSVLTSSVPQLFSKTIVSPLITLSFSSLHVFTLKKNRALPISPKKTLASSTAAAVRRAQKLRLFVVLQPLSTFPCSSSILLAAQSRFARRLSSCSSPSSVVLVPRRNHINNPQCSLLTGQWSLLIPQCSEIMFCSSFLNFNWLL